MQVGLFAPKAQADGSAPEATVADWMAHAVRSDASLRLLLEPLIDMAVLQYRMTGGPSPSDYATARAVGAQLAHSGDAFQWKTARSAGGEPPKIGAIAKALACIAWSPGGLDFCGRHWEER